MRPHRGITLIVVGLLGLVVCGVFGPVVWVMARRDLAEMNAGTLDPAGRGLTVAGAVLGVLGTLLFLAELLFVPSLLGWIHLGGA
ncbi:MAG: hypothetical protein H6828_04140 [Planctomycetes bacterium]|nr:hypothetical protein [Planctomycetota bacterium]